MGGEGEEGEGVFEPRKVGGRLLWGGGGEGFLIGIVGLFS